MEDDIDSAAALSYARRFGRIAVQMGFVSDEQVMIALREQIMQGSGLRLRPKKLIGEILFENGWMTVGQIEKVLERLTQ
jgi:hypothetical protein